MRRKSHYCSPQQLRAAALGKYGAATVYSYHGDVRSVVLEKLSLKTPAKLLESVSLATVERIKSICKEKDLHFPSSFSGILRHYIPYDRPIPMTAQHLFAGVNTSPWVANFQSRVSPAMSYDLNQAYWSSVLEGIPHSVEMRYLRHNETKGWDLACADVKIPEAYLPPPYDEPGKRVRRMVISTNDVDRFGIRVIRLHWGVRFGNVECGRYVDAIGEIYQDWGDEIGKRCAQSLWGRWGAGKLTVRRVTSGGRIEKRWQIRNGNRDLIKMYLAVHRVREKLYDGTQSAIGLARVWVDNFVAECAMVSRGNKPGEWHVDWQADSAKMGGPVTKPSKLNWGAKRSYAKQRAKMEAANAVSTAFQVEDGSLPK